MDRSQIFSDQNSAIIGNQQNSNIKKFNNHNHNCIIVKHLILMSSRYICKYCSEKVHHECKNIAFFIPIKDNLISNCEKC